MTTATSLNNIGAHIATRLEQAIGSRRYAMWFDRSTRFELEDDGQALRVTVANKFLADGIGRQLQTQIDQAAHEELGHGVHLHVGVSKPASATDQAHAHGERSRAAVAPPVNVAGQTAPWAPARRTGKRWRHTLDEFVVGSGSELAFAAAVQMADGDWGCEVDPGSPLFIHGGCGLGKTHLLQGICQRINFHHPQRRVRYTTGEQFTNDFITAVRTNSLSAFRRKIRQLDLLAVDDVHFMACKEKTQQEFLHSFNEIELSGARVVLASDNHPKLIKQFSDALVSRCIRGMVVRIDAPDSATRMRIVEALAERRGLAMPQASAKLIADRCDGSVRDIEGMLTKLQAMSMIDRSVPHLGAGSRVIGHALVDRLFHDQGGLAPRRPVRFEQIMDAVCQLFALPSQLVMGRTRRRHIVLARSLAIYLARDLTSLSYPEIAAAMGRPNHSTIVTAAQRMKRQLNQDEPVLIPGQPAEVKPSQLFDQLRREIITAEQRSTPARHPPGWLA